jgi:uncharacterized protein (DUF2249 family)
MEIKGEHQILDLGQLGKHECSHAIEFFQRLAPGGCFEIKACCLLSQLFFDLQQRHGLGFYWWPLERGPLVWRVKVGKPPQGLSPTIKSVMAADRQRLNELWRGFEFAVSFCQIDDLHQRLGELWLGLRRYIDIEEAILFPLLEAQTHRNYSATEAMRSEHREIERAMEELNKLRSTRDCATILETFDQPIEPMTFFQSHCNKEDMTLYSVIERVLDDAKKTELLSLIQVFEI